MCVVHNCAWEYQRIRDRINTCKKQKIVDYWSGSRTPEHRRFEVSCETFKGSASKPNIVCGDRETFALQRCGCDNNHPYLTCSHADKRSERPREMKKRVLHLQSWDSVVQRGTAWDGTTDSVRGITWKTASSRKCYRHNNVEIEIRGRSSRFISLHDRKSKILAVFSAAR